MKTERTPRFQQLKAGILAQIASGALRPGDRVPSENELVESAGVSRMTANRALRELHKEGIVERITGSGTFVSEHKATSHPLEVRNIAEEVAHRGHAWSADVLTQERCGADRRVADALGVRLRQKVLHVRLVHREDGAPIQLEERYVAIDFAPNFLDEDFTRKTPSACLSAISPLQDAEHVVRAEMPAADVRKTLAMAAGEPCLVIVRRTWSDGRPVSFGRLYHPGARFELSGRFTPSSSTTRPLTAAAIKKENSR